MPTQLAQNIFELRAEGLSYAAIVRQLGCSRSVVCYYCRADQKEKYATRQRARRAQVTGLAHKCNKFQTRNKKTAKTRQVKFKTIRARLRERIWRFHRNGCTGRYAAMEFTVDELLTKIGAQPRCYLTGRPIDLTKTSTYHLDHIMPVSKGGDNSLSNCGLASKAANQAKNDLSVEEFVTLCRLVVAHWSSNSATENRTPVSTLKGSRPDH